MPLILFIAAAIHLGQSQPGTTGLEHYVFVKSDDTTKKLYVLVDPKELDQMDRPSLRVIVDEPWRPWDQRERRIWRDDYEDPYPQESGTRKRRIRDGWREHGGIEVDSADGRIWVHKEEYELAKRAEDIAAAAYVDEVQPTMAPPEPAEEGDAALLGFWAEWGMHIAIVTGALALSAAVIWATLVRGPWTAPKP